MDDDFRKAALDYHRLPRPGKLAIEPTKRMATQRDLALAYSPGVAAACEAIVADPDDSARLHRARQPGGGDLQRHRRARPRQYRRAGRQAGDGGQGRPVQEIRRHRRVRHRGGRRRTRTLSATWWRRWSRPSAPSTSRTSRRRNASRSRPNCARRMRIPVFHDDQHGTAITVAAAVRNGLLLQGKTLDDVQAGDVRRRRGGAGLRRSAGVDGAAAGERHADRHQGRRAHRPAATCCRTWRATRATPTPRTLQDVLAGRRHLPRPVGAARAEAGVAAAAGAEAADPGAGQPRPGDHAGAGRARPARRDHRHRAQRLSEPGQQRAVLPVHLPRRAGRVAPPRSTRR